MFPAITDLTYSYLSDETPILVLPLVKIAVISYNSTAVQLSMSMLNTNGFIVLGLEGASSATLPTPK